jgi:hypothetical protein
MPVLQLVERSGPGPQEFALDLVDLPFPRPVVAGEWPIGMGSSELLFLAAIAPTVGLRAVRVDLGTRTGGSGGSEADALQDVLLELLRDGRLETARTVLEENSRLYVDRVALEEPETRAVVTCNRQGAVSVQGPAVERESYFVAALLIALRNVLDVEN